ncbi:MAG: PA domain-containing protein, partial [Leptolyngbyaceae bacterium]|nr:PA domain-containing protein [Leptolyngbyaceae bacterium]
MITNLLTRLTGSLFCLTLLTQAAVAADVIVVPGDAPGVGFNDPTPATPIGGNPGTTVGQQVLNVFQRAANIWGGRLVSDQPIVVIAFFTPRPCTATSGVLGSAGANWYFRDVPAANGGKGMIPNTWYPAALAEKLTRKDIVADPADTFEIVTFFNSNLGKPGCLENTSWYYGLDNKEASNQIDLLAVVLHELGHGLGFAVNPTSSNTGTRTFGFPSIWERYMFDVSANKRWIDMSDGERATSARNNTNLVWAGQKVSNVIPSVLDFRPEIRVSEPSSLGTHEVQTATFGPQIRNNPGQPISGTIVAPNDSGGVSLLDGCEPFPADPSIPGKIVLIRRGTCTTLLKVFNAQAAGAKAVLIENSFSTGLPPLSGTDSSVQIPAFGITQALGASLRVALPNVSVAIQRSPRSRTGTTNGFVRLYTPTTFAAGSSVSHWDTTAMPNMLMEPF